MAQAPLSVKVYVGRMIERRRKIQKLSLQELAEKIGVTAIQLEDFERGATEPRPLIFARIAEELDVPLSYFYTNIPDALRGPPKKKS